MMLNPEFRRNLWLEISTSRLIGLAVLAGLLVVLLEAGGSITDLSEGYTLTGKIGFFLTAILWGTRRAASGLASELRGATWDWQRLSSMGAWQMTWGKLLGATAFTWLAAIVFLGFLVIGRLKGVEGHALWGYGTGALGLELLSFIIDALLAQAVALAAALVLLRKRHDRQTYAIGFCQGAGLLAYLLLAGADGTFFFGQDAVASIYGARPAVDWYGLSFSAGSFIIGSKLFFLIAAVASCLRLMREELQLRTRPWGWALFLLLFAAYLNGFLVTACATCADSPGIQAALFGAVLGIGSYLALFADRKDPQDIGRFLDALRGRDSRLQERVPRWLPALALTLIFGLAAAFLGIEGEWIDREFVDYFGRRADQYLQALVLASLALLLRDVGIILGMSFGKLRGRADLMTIFWLGLLYMLVPLVLQGMGLHRMASTFTPATALEPWTAFAGAAVQAIVALGWAVYRWRASQRAFMASLPKESLTA